MSKFNVITKLVVSNVMIKRGVNNETTQNYIHYSQSTDHQSQKHVNSISRTEVDRGKAKNGFQLL